MMGQRAERLQREREREEAMAVMHRKTRSMTRTRALLQKRLPPFLGSQDSWAEELQREQQNHESDLKTATADSFKREDKRDISRLKHWIADADKNKLEIKKMRSEISDLRKITNDVEQEIRETQQKIADRIEECSRFRTVSLCKVLKRYDMECQNFGRQLVENRQLIQEMSHLRARMAFIGRIECGLQKKLTHLDLQLSRNVAVAKETYDKQGTANRKLTRLDEHFHRSSDAFTKDMGDYTLKIDELKKLERFSLRKSQMCEDELHEWREWMAQQPSLIERGVQEYHEVTKKVFDVLGEDNLLDVIDTFIGVKEENFLLFRNVSEAKELVQEEIAETERTKEAIDLICSEMSTKRKEQKMYQEELKEKRDTCKQIADEKEAEMAKADEKIDLYIQCVLDILRKLDYTQDEFTKLAGAYGKAEQRNVLRFFSEVEHCVDKLWAIRVFLEFKAHDSHNKSKMIPAAVTPLPRRVKLSEAVSVILPADDDDAPECLPSDSDIRPYSALELQPYVTEELSRRSVRSTSPRHLFRRSSDLETAHYRRRGDSSNTKNGSKRPGDVF